MQNILDLTQNDTVVFSDAEYIHEYLSYGRPQKNHWKEVTQIGAVKYQKGKPIETFNRNIRPDIKALSLSTEDWKNYESVTGICKDIVMNYEENFNQVWKDYKKFVNDHTIVIMLGDKDVFKWNLKLINSDVKNELSSLKFIKLKPLLPNEYHHLSSGQLYEIVGKTSFDVAPDGKVHDALFDAKSMGLFCANFKLK